MFVKNTINTIQLEEENNLTLKKECNLASSEFTRLNNINQSLKETTCAPISCNKLSIIIAFYNEGEEVKNTIKSIRDTAGSAVDIIVVNDCSNDGYPYKEELSIYNIIYSENKHRLGASLSKERGIRISNTPFFIVLDAHMRIFTNNWVNVLTQNLIKNPNGIVCCQTIALTKTADNKILIIDSVPQTHGAFLTFREDFLVPGIHWFTGTHSSQSLNSSIIAAVLGGCYASSRNYWNLIDGFDGLLDYGCEEAYISLKSWLTGAGCRIISQIKIGHIYRSVPKFTIQKASFIYNFLAISEILFPNNDQCYTHAIARHYNIQEYNKACTLIKHNRNKLQQYRSKWMDFHAHFQAIKNLNLKFSLSQSGLWDSFSTQVNKITEFVCSHNTIRNGLYNGISCDLLFLLRYVKYTVTDQDTKMRNCIQDKCIELYTRIVSDIKAKALSWNLEVGYSGIGWSLLYIRDHKLIEDDISALLEIIDRAISELSPQRITDQTLRHGIPGLLQYVTRRLNDKNNALDKNFISDLHLWCKNNKQTIHDPKSYASILQLEQFKENNTLLYSLPQIADIISPPRIIPESQNAWIHGICGITGYALQILELHQLQN